MGSPEALDDWRHGNPGGAGWALLTPALLADLRMALDGSAPDGGLWTGPKLAQWLSERLGHPVWPRRGWEALWSLSFTSQRPRPRAVRADPEEHLIFKKEGSQAVADPVRAAHPDVTLTVWAEDEHRLGLLPVMTRV